VRNAYELRQNHQQRGRPWLRFFAPHRAYVGFLFHYCPIPKIKVNPLSVQYYAFGEVIPTIETGGYTDFGKWWMAMPAIRFVKAGDRSGQRGQRQTPI
jgi:hypothetical protein